MVPKIIGVMIKLINLATSFDTSGNGLILKNRSKKIRNMKDNIILTMNRLEIAGRGAFLNERKT